jgi:hypothetical protein
MTGIRTSYSSSALRKNVQPYRSAPAIRLSWPKTCTADAIEAAHLLMRNNDQAGSITLKWKCSGDAAALRLFMAATLCCAFAQQALAQDPPTRVARLSYISGNVSMQPAGVDEWAPADLNRPFTLGDSLYTDSGARAELHLDVGVIRLGPSTTFSFLNLSDQAVQIKVTEGDMYFRIRHLPLNQTFEIDTPNAAITLLRDGVYRFRVDANDGTSFVVVREGEAEITGGGKAFSLNPGNSAYLSGSNPLSYDVEVAPAPDDFDNWCSQRDQREAHLASTRYLPPSVIGYEDLDDYGSWQVVAGYGAVWYPREISVGWAPYHVGHWAWIEPWGWTWVDDAPWGFTCFHYGRWAFITGHWGWCPGPIAIVENRPPVIGAYYAPAMVAWFGGAHWGVSVSVGGPSLGWVALGFGELYTPSYQCSQSYFSNVNISNTRVANNVNITNIYKSVYVNKTVYQQNFANVRVPNAVMAMPQNAFASGQPVKRAGVVVPPAQVGRLQASAAAVVAPPVAPTRQALLATAAKRPAVHPPAQILSRPVVAKTSPPPPPPSFAARQAYLQQHAGGIHDFQTMHRAVAPQARPEARPVSTVAPVSAPKRVALRPGQRVGSFAEKTARNPLLDERRRPPQSVTQTLRPARSERILPHYPVRSIERPSLAHPPMNAPRPKR